jgi:tetratricopeptide (TPR) repeat protein
MAATSTPNETLALVHEGWNHLMSQRPLAAWGTWQRALRRDPESASARQALQTLESAPDLPLVARKVHRFRKPTSESQRARWDHALRLGASEELTDAIDRFRALTDEAPEDAAAWYNLGLCLAWSGDDRRAIDCLDRATTLDAEGEQKRAVEAWALAEILRQGGGAETLADDLRYACTFPWESENTPQFEAHVPELRRIPTPRDPTRSDHHAVELEVLEWLDRPFPAAGSVRTEVDLPRVLATVYIGEGTLRLSSPRVDTLEQVEERLRRLMGGELPPGERVAAPLPLPFLDADVWTTRMPEGIDRELAHGLTREAVESYYENTWIHRPRQSLDGLSPLAASLDARRGDAVARSKLEAVVLVREQLGGRPSAAALYQGYPFDRLRRRLGLEMVHPELVDPHDVSCASLPELQQIQPEDLDDPRLADAFHSAAGLRDDSLTARFAEELVHRASPLLGQLDLSAVYAPLVRQAMQRRDTSQALTWLEQARDGAGEALRRSFDTWRAEILARCRRPEAAAQIYRELVEGSSSPAQTCLDAGETLLDQGHREHARGFLTQARDLARSENLPWVDKLAGRYLAESRSHR